MPFPMKIQPVNSTAAAARGIDAAGKPPAPAPPAKSRLKRLFERQFPGVLKTAAPPERDDVVGGGGGETEPSSVCLAKMVQNFMEENSEKPPRCGRRRCNCFNGNNCSDSSDGEHEIDGDHAVGDAAELLRGLAPCVSVAERNLLADASKIVDKFRSSGKGKDDRKRILAGELRSLGYDSSICRSRWENNSSIPAGEHEYVDVIVKGERLLVEMEFRSEFEIARPTKAYRAALQCVPAVFVGRADRLRQVVAIASEAARLSLKKKGLHLPPWRKPEYMSSKWLAPYQRITGSNCTTDLAVAVGGGGDLPILKPAPPVPAVDPSSSDPEPEKPPIAVETPNAAAVAVAAVEMSGVVAPPWKPPALKPKPSPAGSKVVFAGLASVLGEAF